jgi:hypothetical protein|tara:strand:+ start:69 stop:218 length:150 start_codon:yes stop_codon:yes gene_type:complete
MRSITRSICPAVSADPGFQLFGQIIAHSCGVVDEVVLLDEVDNRQRRGT